MKEFYRYLVGWLIIVSTSLLIAGFYANDYGYVLWILTGIAFLMAMYLIYRYRELCIKQDELDIKKQAREEEDYRRERARKFAPRTRWLPNGEKNNKK